MHFSTFVAAAVALATAQANIAFTSTPGASVTAGQSVTLKWDGAQDGAPVTITLKMGDPNDLTTVALITGNAQGGSYTWTPSTSIVNGNNYALEISQGTGFDETNYSGEFSITGGATSSSSSATSQTVTMTSGNSTFVTSHPFYPATTGSVGTGSAHNHTNNATLATTSMAPMSTATGGIMVPTTTNVAPSPTSVSASASSSAGAAAIGPIGGLGAALIGLAAFL